MKRVVNISFLLCGLSFCIYADTYFQTVDEKGRPLSGVHVALSWTGVRGPQKGRAVRNMFASDGNGRFSVDDSCLVIDNYSVKKDGYLLEDYLNPCLWHRLLYQRHKSSVEHPFRLTLRKKLDERALLVGVYGPDYGICIARRGEQVKPFELGVVRTADDKGFVDADCFAQPLFDEVEKRWKCAFWTTNALGGVLATTNRVFIAPETGYAKRVEVPLEMCHQPSFTLYARTYRPQLYAMFCIYGFASGRRWVEQRKFRSDLYTTNDLPRAESPYVALEVEESVYTPLGERILEGDDIVLWKPVHEAFPFLRQHRYPPRPDLPARRIIWEKIWKTYDEKSKMRTELHALEKRRWGMPELQRPGDKNASMEKLDREIETLRQAMRTITRERENLERKSETLNLP